MNNRISPNMRRSIRDDIERLAPLLQPIVDATRAVFDAGACSVMMVDTQSEQLVFAAVSGDGEDGLVGQGFPLTAGIAGSVLQSQQSIRLDDVSERADFARDTASSTGYVPSMLMAAPLVAGDQSIGVLEVLDWSHGSRSDLDDLSLLDLLSRQAAAALAFVGATNLLAGDLPDIEVSRMCRELVGNISSSSGARREDQERLLSTIVRLTEPHGQSEPARVMTSKGSRDA